MAQYIFDFIGISSTDLTFLTMTDVLKVLIYLYAGMYCLRVILSFVSSIFPGGKNSVFRGL